MSRHINSDPFCVIAEHFNHKYTRLLAKLWDHPAVTTMLLAESVDSPNKTVASATRRRWDPDKKDYGPGMRDVVIIKLCGRTKQAAIDILVGQNFVFNTNRIPVIVVRGDQLKEFLALLDATWVAAELERR